MIIQCCHPTSITNMTYNSDNNLSKEDVEARGPVSNHNHTLIPPPTSSLLSIPMNNIIHQSSVDSKEAETSKATSQKEHNNLLEKLIGDVLSALTITFFVSPCLVIVDKSVIQRTAGTHTITQSVKETVGNMLRRPLTYIRSPTFLMMWGVYASTYSTANVLKTLIEFKESSARKNHQEPPSTEYTKYGSFLMTTFVNSSLSLVKDRSYATMFGKPGASSLSFPLVTYGIWGLRDLTVIGSGFLLPEIMGKVLQERTNLNRIEALSISQMTCPIAAQLVATPLQLLGLDLYNRPMANTTMFQAVKERSSLIYNNFLPSVTIRLGRIVPALGIGGVGNIYLRDSWREMIMQRENNKTVYTSFEDSNRISRVKQLERSLTIKKVHMDEI